MNNLDIQLKQFSDKLKNEVGIPDIYLDEVANKIQLEVSNLTSRSVQKIKTDSTISLQHRYNELKGFQLMMDFMNNNNVKNAGLIRSQVITQNYICFVYLKDSYFKSLQKITPVDSITHRCCKFLVSGELRKFRNAIAHGNWNYKSDFDGLEYWDFKNGNKSNGYEKFEINQNQLNFWQTLSRVVAYCSIEIIINK